MDSAAYLQKLQSESLSASLREIRADSAGYVRPFLERRRTHLFQSVGMTERPDELCDKLPEGRIAVLIDGTPFSLFLPQLFREHFQTLDDYNESPVYATLIRWLKFGAVSIVGGLIIGDAAVNSGLVSTPVLTMTVLSVTAGFVVPELHSILTILRLFLIFSAAVCGLSGVAAAPNPSLTIATLLIITLYLSFSSSDVISRAAVLLLVFAAAAFLLLIGYALPSLRSSTLRIEPLQTSAFASEIAQNAETALLPLLCTDSPRQTHKAAWWRLGIRVLIFQLLLVFCAMQCGRLTAYRGSPFLLLLARMPFHDSLRPDGLFLMFAVSCCLICMAFLFRVFCENTKKSIHLQWTDITVLTSLALLFIKHPPDSSLLGFAALLLSSAVLFTAKGTSA